MALKRINKVMFYFKFRKFTKNARRIYYSVWKFWNFSAAQILREIDFEGFRNWKTAIFGKFQLSKMAKIH